MTTARQTTTAGNVVTFPVRSRTDAPPAFDDVYEAHFDSVYRWAARLAPHADAEDIAQEVFLVVHRKLGEFRGAARLSTWLFQITYHVLGNYLRKRRVERRALGLLSRDESRLPAADGAVRNEEIQALRRGIERLPLEHRSVLVLFELEQWPCADIAAALGIPVNTVYSRLHHAREKLARELGHGRGEGGRTGRDHAELQSTSDEAGGASRGEPRCGEGEP